jgi:hypothetical protein
MGQRRKHVDRRGTLEITTVVLLQRGVMRKRCPDCSDTGKSLSGVDRATTAPSCTIKTLPESSLETGPASYIPAVHRREGDNNNDDVVILYYRSREVIS